MFVGHYAASLALKRFESRASLGLLFLGVQLVDILFFPFVLLGVERINIIENYTQSTHFQLEYMPYTHSLVGSGAGAEGRSSIGWVVFGGLGLAAVFTLYLTPALYLLLAPLSKARSVETDRLSEELRDVEIERAARKGAAG